jgi:hypothetical protein
MNYRPQTKTKRSLDPTRPFSFKKTRSFGLTSSQNFYPTTSQHLLALISPRQTLSRPPASPPNSQQRSDWTCLTPKSERTESALQSSHPLRRCRSLSLWLSRLLVRGNERWMKEKFGWLEVRLGSCEGVRRLLGRSRKG